MYLRESAGKRRRICLRIESAARLSDESCAYVDFQHGDAAVLRGTDSRGTKIRKANECSAGIAATQGSRVRWGAALRRMGYIRDRLANYSSDYWCKYRRAGCRAILATTRICDSGTSSANGSSGQRAPAAVAYCADYGKRVTAFA